MSRLACGRNRQYWRGCGRGSRILEGGHPIFKDANDGIDRDDIRLSFGSNQGGTPMTLLDALIQSVTRAGEYNRNDQVAPAVVLWPDKERQSAPLSAAQRHPASLNIIFTTRHSRGSLVP